jgi:hypothetical protein
VSCGFRWSAPCVELLTNQNAIEQIKEKKKEEKEEEKTSLIYNL